MRLTPCCAVVTRPFGAELLKAWLLAVAQGYRVGREEKRGASSRACGKGRWSRRSSDQGNVVLGNWYTTGYPSCAGVFSNTCCQRHCPTVRVAHLRLCVELGILVGAVFPGGVLPHINAIWTRTQPLSPSITRGLLHALQQRCVVVEAFTQCPAGQGLVMLSTGCWVCCQNSLLQSHSGLRSLCTSLKAWAIAGGHWHPAEGFRCGIRCLLVLF